MYINAKRHEHDEVPGPMSAPLPGTSTNPHSRLRRLTSEDRYPPPPPAPPLLQFLSDAAFLPVVRHFGFVSLRRLGPWTCLSARSLRLWPRLPKTGQDSTGVGSRRAYAKCY